MKLALELCQFMSGISACLVRCVSVCLFVVTLLMSLIVILLQVHMLSYLTTVPESISIDSDDVTLQYRPPLCYSYVWFTVSLR